MALLNFESFDFYDATYYGTLFCKMMGLWPLPWRPGMKLNVMLEALIIVPWLIVLTFFSYDNVTNTVFWNDFYNVTESNILTWGTRLQNFACLILAIIIITLTVVQRMVQENSFHTLFDHLVYVDKILENEYNYDMQFELCARILFVITMFLLTSMIAFFVLSYVVFQRLLGLNNPKFYVSFFLANLPFVTTISAFIIFLMSVRCRFVYINDIFEQMRFQTPENVYVYDENKIDENLNELKHSDKKVFTISNKAFDNQSTASSTRTVWVDTRSSYTKLMDFLSCKSVVKKIKINKTTSNKELKQNIDRLIHLHSKLCDCIDISNELLSFKLLLATVYMFVFIVFACFTGYRVMYDEHSKGDVVAIADIFWMGYYIVLTIGITTSGSLTVNAAKYTGRVVHKVIHKTWDPVIIQRLTIASQQLLMRKPVLTCYLFPFNWSLLFAMFSSNTTYLVFLIQLDVASKNKAMNMFNFTNGGNGSVMCHQ